MLLQRYFFKRIIISFINFVLSFIAIFIRAAKTERYQQALIYLDQRNNSTFTNYTYINCQLSGFFKDDTYCEIDGRMLKKPEENVSYQSLFKNWEKIELIINILRTFITGIYLVFSCVVINKFNNYLINTKSNDIREKEKYSNLWLLLIIFLVFLIFTSGLFIFIRALALTANDHIGLYEDGRQNQFEEHTAINYIIDIINITLNSIAICFVLRIKRGLYRRPIEVINIDIQMRSVEIKMRNIELNQFPDNKFRLPPIDNYN